MNTKKIVLIMLILVAFMSMNAMAAVPDAPENMTNTTGNGWVRWAWDVGTGSGNATDSYNVSTAYDSITTWTNGTVDNYKKVSGVGDESVTICVYGYNVTWIELSTVTTDTVTVPLMFASIVNLIDAIIPLFTSILDLIIAVFPLIIAMAFLGGLAYLINKIFDGALNFNFKGKK